MNEKSQVSEGQSI